nr:serine--tRNA ligase [Salaquimonas pukyongi]
MFDIRWIRENPAAFDKGLARRGLAPQSESLIALDEKRRAHTGKVQEAQQRRNAASREIGQAMGAGDTEKAEKLKAEVAGLKTFLTEAEDTERKINEELKSALEVLPNLPLDDVPDGEDENDNTLYREHGEKPEFAFTPKEHFEIGVSATGMDFDQAAKLSGARFVVLKGEIARLERALGQFMLDLHTNEHGYTEVAPPLLVNDATMYGTGQLPKFAEDLFQTRADDEERFWGEYVEDLNKPRSPHVSEAEAIESARKRSESWMKRLVGGEFSKRMWLIPTAEVPLTNMVREEIVEKKDLPMRMCALTFCFRSEAGSAGRDTRGMLRQHQFNKVELVSITDKESSLDELERMLSCAEKTLQLLGLHYRVMTLCTGDMGFGARKTYDIEVWLPGQGAYREISSCSVCGDFQARRMNARYREEDGKTLSHVHTLNGSGVAVGRMLIAVLENHQQEDGSVRIPEALQPYMGGKTVIGEARGA